MKQKNIRIKITGNADDRKDRIDSSRIKNSGMPVHNRRDNVSITLSIRVITIKTLRPTLFSVILYHLTTAIPTPAGSIKL